MQLSKRTLAILKGYSSINASIVVNKGKKLSTMAIPRNILAEADIEEDFPQEFAIYNLNEFLAAVSLFNDPELEFAEKWVNIREKGSKKGGIKYFYSNKALIVHPTKPLKNIEEFAVEFTLTEDTLARLTKAADVLGVKDVTIVADEEGISLVVQDRKNDSSNDFEIQVSDKPAKEFRAYLKRDNLKMISGTYQVRVAERGIAIFTREDGSMRYAIALEA